MEDPPRDSGVKKVSTPQSPSIQASPQIPLSPQSVPLQTGHPIFQISHNFNANTNQIPIPQYYDLSAENNGQHPSQNQTPFPPQYPHPPHYHFPSLPSSPYYYPDPVHNPLQSFYCSSTEPQFSPNSTSSSPFPFNDSRPQSSTSTIVPQSSVKRIHPKQRFEVRFTDSSKKKK